MQTIYLYYPLKHGQFLAVCWISSESLSQLGWDISSNDTRLEPHDYYSCTPHKP